MADEKLHEPPQEPSGFTDHTRSLAGEYAHEQGWSLNEEERTLLPETKQDFEGGTDYEYGARDFGDTAVDTSAVRPSPQAIAFVTASPDQDPDETKGQKEEE